MAGHDGIMMQQELVNLISVGGMLTEVLEDQRRFAPYRVGLLKVQWGGLRRGRHGRNGKQSLASRGAAGGGAGGFGLP